MPVRILIADDNAVFRQSLRTMVETRVGWEVCGEAVDGLDAVKKHRLLTPDLVIMDFSMPYMTGTEAASEILKQYPAVPILLLTLYVTPQLVKNSRNFGIRAIVSKTAMSDILDAIHALLRGESFTAPVREKQTD